MTAFLVNKLLSWTRKNSLWYFYISGGCCGDELLQTAGCRYDLERFGCIQKAEPSQADLLIIHGVVTRKISNYVKEVYEQMSSPKYVMVLGSCVNSGGLFSGNMVVNNIQELFPVDVFVAGCPPRPEAIMSVLIKLQEKIIHE
ncbi:MAG: NADH-quinone oxidoreductase subunit NuoB [Bdellovibrio sp.]|nr:NADH-quinone oxidoreductase subunit NuoB [Bdellovibrio sp.]